MVLKTFKELLDTNYELIMRKYSLNISTVDTLNSTNIHTTGYKDITSNIKDNDFKILASNVNNNIRSSNYGIYNTNFKIIRYSEIIDRIFDVFPHMSIYHYNGLYHGKALTKNDSLTFSFYSNGKFDINSSNQNDYLELNKILQEWQDSLSEKTKKINKN